MKRIYKENISSIVPYEPGKPIEEVERELGLSRVVKLASNENPLGTSQKALRAVQKALRTTHLYPDGNSYYLKERLAKELNVSTNQLVIGNGSNEIIELLIRGFISEGDNVISSETSFLVYPLTTKTCGGNFISVPMKDFRFDLKAILGRINNRTRLIFIANPNNPTGTYVTHEEVEDFLSKVPQNVIVCFDEAYYDFVDVRDFPYTLFHVKSNKPNLVILRTFSKSYGLAGLRVGYGIANPELVQYLDKIRQPFNINSLAQAAALAALDDARFLQRTKRLILKERKYLYRRFDAMKLRYIPSQANFILVDMGQPAGPVFDALLKNGVIVRLMKAYGLPSYVRITIGTHSENRTMLRQLKKVLNIG